MPDPNRKVENALGVAWTTKVSKLGKMASLGNDPNRIFNRAKLRPDTKPTQRLVAAQNATEILAQILRAANVEVPAEIEGPKKPRAINAPESQ